MHVVQAPCVGLQASHRMGLAFGVERIPSHDIDASGKWRGTRGPAGVFPLGLGRQSEAPMGIRRIALDFCQEIRAVIPRHAVHWQQWIAVKLRGLPGHHFLPNGLGAFGVRQPETLTDFHSVLRLIGPTAGLSRRASNEDPARGNPTKRHRLTADSEDHLVPGGLSSPSLAGSPAAPGACQTQNQHGPENAPA